MKSVSTNTSFEAGRVRYGTDIGSLRSRLSLMALAAAALVYTATPLAAQPVAGQIVPVAVYLDLDHPFGLAYDAVNNLIWYTRGDTGDNLVHSLKPFKAFTAAELAALPDIGGVKQISLADGQNDVAGTTAVAGSSPLGSGAYFSALAFDCSSGQLVATSGEGSLLKSFDPFTGANVNFNYSPGSALSGNLVDGLDVDGGTVWWSPDVGNIYKNGVLFADTGNAAQTTLPGWSGLGSEQTLGWSGAEQVANSLFAVAVQDGGDAGRTRSIVRFNANTGELLGFDPDGDPVAARWEDLAFDGRFLYAADLRGDANGTGAIGDIYVFALTGGLEPCAIVCPSDIVASADADQCSAIVNFEPTTTGDCAGSSVACVPPSGTRFPVGTTPVTCTVTFSDNPPDCPANDLQRTCTFNVTVEDNTAPAITCPGNITQCNDAGKCDAVVTFSASAIDNCDPNPSVSCSPASGSTFPHGTTPVTCTATDVAGNAASCTFTVTVNDCEAPVADCVPTTNVAGDTTPPPVNPDGFFLLLATDNCDATAGLQIFVKDSIAGPCGGTFAAGPYAPGTKVKLVNLGDHGKKASVKKMAGVITAIIQTIGDPVLVVTDSSGNQVCHLCLVPPPPK